MSDPLPWLMSVGAGAVCSFSLASFRLLALLPPPAGFLPSVESYNVSPGSLAETPPAAVCGGLFTPGYTADDMVFSQTVFR